MYAQRKLTIYVADKKPFPDGILFVAYYRAVPLKNARMDLSFFEHAARGDIEGLIWFARLTGLYTWDFLKRNQLDSRMRDFMLYVDETRWADLEAFFGKCTAAIEDKPHESFRIAFR